MAMDFSVSHPREQSACSTNYFSAVYAISVVPDVSAVFYVVSAVNFEQLLLLLPIKYQPTRHHIFAAAIENIDFFTIFQLDQITFFSLVFSR